MLLQHAEAEDEAEEAEQDAPRTSDRAADEPADDIPREQHRYDYEMLMMTRSGGVDHITTLTRDEYIQLKRHLAAVRGLKQPAITGRTGTIAAPLANVIPLDSVSKATGAFELGGSRNLCA